MESHRKCYRLVTFRIIDVIFHLVSLHSQLLKSRWAFQFNLFALNFIRILTLLDRFRFRFLKGIKVLLFNSFFLFQLGPVFGLIDSIRVHFGIEHNWKIFRLGNCKTLCRMFWTWLQSSKIMEGTQSHVTGVKFLLF